MVEIEMQFSGKVAEGDRLVKEAKQHLKSNVLQLRFKPDWESAVPLFEKAAVAYQLGNAYEQAMAMYKQVADAQMDMNSSYKAGKAFEEAAKMAKQLKQWEEVGKFTEQAALAYFQAGKFNAGAEALSNGAKFLASAKHEEACNLYVKAIKALETDDRLMQTTQIYRDGINTMLEGGLYDGASSLLNRFGKQAGEEGRADTRNKALLGAVVVLLYAGNVENAYQSYQHHSSTDEDFSRSQEASAALSLLHAYSTQDSEAIKSVIKEHTVFIHLETSVSRLAKKLPAQDPKSLPKLSFGIEQVQNDMQQEEEDEEDIT
eukprot:TRINITY_DN5636_c1_g1_i1.p1 TRINITY_DN5636_c1_g1~~TRINITY_DN5636_c1_g1_i1.p1  ORF type:complete len:317 (+),score=66.78 TRINITY_DN5636_c1_g1_i1:31-981(+)